ncbi:peptidylprolyl isomerase [Ferruginibacter albus]|uniref:peptidylprolyl isomerase n=1 Tax=Ferruginibacter albus TaxID=2875540 RepID=UPI001CC3CE77|nr:peptidylprolyl isomerase [Ferruginibacter albus]UAY52092.1 SurA N-terminal domain-containing protein [Ferruginibacter albus]
MQIIQSIRKRAAIATALIAIAIIGFILLDAKNGSAKLFGKGASNSIGKINGVTVDVNDFDTKVKQFEQQYGGRAGSTYQAREQVWNQEVQENLMDGVFEKLGMSLSPKELSSILFSDEAPQSWKQYFTDQNGQFDVSKAQQAWAQIKKSKGKDREDVEAQLIDPLVRQTLFIKYSSLISAGAYYPSWMQKQDAVADNGIANISYVGVPFSTISDSSVKVSDDDINDYVQKHKAQYTLDEGGKLLSYVGFSTDPSKADSSTALDQLTALKSDFATDTNTTVFLAKNSSAIQFDDFYELKSKINSSKKDTILSLANNALYGPYLENGDYMIAKKLGEREIPDTIKCRHILIATSDPKTGNKILDDSAAKKRIDSIVALINAGQSFDSLVQKYSDDPGSKDKKGEYEFPYYTNDPQRSPGFRSLAKEFAETVFFGKKGDKKVIHTTFGWHYIEVLDQRSFEPAYKIAYLAKQITSSQETINMAQSKATTLAGQARDTKAFNEYATKNNLVKIDVPSIVKENDFQVGGLQDARQLVKWAFDANEGEVSDPMNIDDKYIVATITKVQKAGLPDAAVARPQVEMLIRNQKKADQIIAKIGKDASVEKAGSTYNVPVQNAGADSSLTFGSFFISGIGQEPKVIGAAFNKDYQTKSSEPIIGNNGVYVIKVNSVGNKATDTPEAAASKTTQKERQIAQQFGYGWMEALKKTADIKDDRSKFF